jgi:hypothetical protein
VTDHRTGPTATTATKHTPEVITVNDQRIATVGDLIAALDRYDPAAPVRFATQPGYPLEHTLGRVVRTPDDTDGDGTPPIGSPVVWLGIGEQVGYLPAPAADALGWSR